MVANDSARLRRDGVEGDVVASSVVANGS